MKSSKRARHVSPVRLRPMIVALCIVAVFIAVPLLLVWKQAFIADTSMTIERLNDTLSVMNREIGSLRILRERYADNERIEAIARSALALDYPSSDRITIVSSKHASKDKVSSFLTALRARVKKGGDL